MDKYDKAIAWGHKALEQELVKEPIKISNFETIFHPEEYVKTNIIRMQGTNIIEAELAYCRIEKLAKHLKNKLK